MNSAQLCFGILLLSVLASAQEDDGFSETPACYANMCKHLKKFDALGEKVQALEARLRNSEFRHQRCENQIQELKNKETNQVIFSVAAGHGDTALGPYNSDRILNYATVITNIGNAYHRATGTFVAPYAGVYYFTFFCHAGGEKPVFLKLIKNGNLIVEIHDHASSQDTADNGGNAVFLQLQQGDHLYLRMDANTHVWGGDYATTFSGFLVHQL